MTNLNMSIYTKIKEDLECLTYTRISVCSNGVCEFNIHGSCNLKTIVIDTKGKCVYWNIKLSHDCGKED